MKQARHITIGNILRQSNFVLLAAVLLALAAFAPVCAGADAQCAALTLNATDAEVWTWQKEISGISACEQCAEIEITVNGKSQAVTKQGKAFRALPALGEGANRIKVSCRHRDGDSCATEEVVFYQRLRARPTARLKISVSMERNVVVFDASGSTANEATGAPVARYFWGQDKDNPARLDHKDWVSLRPDKRMLTKVPAADGEYYFSVVVVDADGRRDRARAYFAIEDGRARQIDTDNENAAWIDEAVVYGTLPHMFGRPPFVAVAKKLDYLKELGVTALWLGPSMDTLTGNGYAVTDYFEPRPDYGTKAEFKRLVQEAHKRGIRVMMDIVPNHSSVRHRYIRHAIAYQEKSPYFYFYDRAEPGGPHTYYFGWQDLPNLNYSNPEVQRWMIEAFSYWVREFDVDGFRIDAIWGVKERQPDFALKLRREMTRIKPDIFMLAEAGARDPYYFDNGFDAAYDWTERLGNWAWDGIFADEERLVERLHEALTNEGRGYHPDALVFHFLNNNDTGTPFVIRHGVGMTRVAAALLLSLPGVPCVYTAEEVGTDFHPYRTPGPISWEDSLGLHDYYQKLIALRKAQPSLHSRAWEILPVESDAQVYAYLRYGEAGATPLLVVLNFSDMETLAKIAPPESVNFERGGEFEDLISGDSIAMQDGELALGAYTAYILRAL